MCQWLQVPTWQQLTGASAGQPQAAGGSIRQQVPTAVGYSVCRVGTVPSRQTQSGRGPGQAALGSRWHHQVASDYSGRARCPGSRPGLAEASAGHPQVAGGSSKRWKRCLGHKAPEAAEQGKHLAPVGSADQVLFAPVLSSTCAFNCATLLCQIVLV